MTVPAAAAAGDATQTPRRRRRRGSSIRVSRAVHLFALPAIAIYAVFVLYPVAITLVNSFYDFKGITRAGFAGLDNFRKLYLQAPMNERVLNALGNNILIFLVLVAGLVLAFIIGAVLHQLAWGREFFKAAYFVPRLLSLIVVGFLWQLIFSPHSGALNALLDAVGLSGLTRAWLATPTSALVSVMLVNVWNHVGFNVLIFLAAMQGINKNIFEAARLDGASPLSILLRVTLPLTKSAWMILVILSFISAFETFDLVYAMQGVTGAPYYATDTLGLIFYRLAFGGMGGTAAIGLGSALALSMLVVMALASFVMFKFFSVSRE